MVALRDVVGFGAAAGLGVDPLVAFEGVDVVASSPFRSSSLRRLAERGEASISQSRDVKERLRVVDVFS